MKLVSLPAAVAEMDVGPHGADAEDVHVLRRIHTRTAAPVLENTVCPRSSDPPEKIF